MAAGNGVNAVVVLIRDDVEVVLGRIVGLRANLRLVDALARLQLTALRLGCSIRLREPCPELQRLLLLVGLADLVSGASVLGVEVVRKAEGGEQLAIEEVVQPGDPPA
jgi:hypothetical protein